MRFFRLLVVVAGVTVLFSACNSGETANAPTPSAEEISTVSAANGDRDSGETAPPGTTTDLGSALSGSSTSGGDTTLGTDVAQAAIDSTTTPTEFSAQSPSVTQSTHPDNPAVVNADTNSTESTSASSADHAGAGPTPTVSGQPGDDPFCTQLLAFADQFSTVPNTLSEAVAALANADGALTSVADVASPDKAESINVARQYFTEVRTAAENPETTSVQQLDQVLPHPEAAAALHQIETWINDCRAVSKPPSSGN